MTASIDFTDATGAASLSNGLDAPFDRFGNWTPATVPVGAFATAVGPGAIHAYVFRDDYVAGFELAYLPADQIEIAQRLTRHLLTGGTVTLTTADAGARTYTCRLAPDTTPELELTDRQLMEYTYRVRLKNTAAAPLICRYP